MRRNMETISVLLAIYVEIQGCVILLRHDADTSMSVHGHLARYVKLMVAHALGMPGTFFPPLKRKPLDSDPGMHHGTCVTHVPWCMSGSLTFPAFPAYAQPAILRFRQEAHGRAAFIWKQCCHWMRRLRQHHVVKGPEIGDRITHTKDQ